MWQSLAHRRRCIATEGGECFGALDARVRAACEELAGRIAGEDIVVVSHVSPIKAAVAWALDTSLEIMFHCHLSQASVCRVDDRQVRAAPPHVQRTTRPHLTDSGRAEHPGARISACRSSSITSVTSRSAPIRLLVEAPADTSGTRSTLCACRRASRCSRASRRRSSPGSRRMVVRTVVVGRRHASFASPAGTPCVAGRRTLRTERGLHDRRRAHGDQLVSDIVHYIKGQRCSGIWDGADRAAPRVGDGERRDVHGGWYDASGDYSKYLSHLCTPTS